MTAPTPEATDGFTDFNENTSPPLTVPINSKLYVIPPVGIRTALVLLKAIDGDEAAVAQFSTGDAWYRMLLGSAYQQMQDDNCDEKAVDRAALTALVDFKHGRVAAQICWKTGSDPEALGRFLAASQAIAMSRAASESTTQLPDSSKGTTTPKIAPSPEET